MHLVRKWRNSVLQHRQRQRQQRRQVRLHGIIRLWFVNGLIGAKTISSNPALLGGCTHRYSKKKAGSERPKGRDGSRGVARLQTVAQVLQQVGRRVQQPLPPAQRLRRQRPHIHRLQPPGQAAAVQRCAPPGRLHQPAGRNIS
jgi:hypothetical protein